MRPELLSIIEQDEGLRLFVYDDATGLPIKPGSYVKGHPTIGYGIDLDIGGITQQEAAMLISNRIGAFEQRLLQLPWFIQLDNVRQDAITNMSYQLGVTGMLQFKSMIGCLQRSDWQGAHDQMLASRWAAQTPLRAQQVAKMVLTGQYPS